MYDSDLYIWRNLMEDGTQCLGDEQYLKAEKYFIQGLLKAYELTVPEILAFTLRLLATVRVRLGNLELAEEGFKEALRICQEIQNAKGMAEAWAGLASISVKKRMLPKAVEEYEQAIAVYPKSSPQLRLGMLYADMGQVYTALEKWTCAKNSYAKAVELCRLYGFPKGEAELDVLSGELCFRLGQKTEALGNLKHACQLFAQLQDMVALSTTLQYLALLYFDQNEMRLALESQQRAVSLCLKFDTKEVFSESCYFLSKIEQNLEDYLEARYYLELSVHFYPEQTIDFAIRYQNLGSLLFLSMDYTKSEIYYLKALNLFELYQDDQRKDEVYEALALLKGLREQNDGPLNTRHKPEDRSKLHGEFTLEALIHLAEFYEKRHNDRDALECYWKALKKGRDAEVATDWIEYRVQQVSKRLRKKK
ncbi:tetratricopeptide repeat protein [Desulfosporosinus shakirovi]|uniref:tetratricopeptide repeat protein n=1 Tax=Desulfosporosinus shakirovi TaxID=2885154 RepID=UPI001E528CB1|nr:tetratricopeptide repeat protein [Desulfosporosinus sp. SRJS8]MCB8816597.1 tetratricopeptide repeat protein [Desulfosporosinus sp. SRJS8]